ncbi:MAG: recombinase family protein [Oscillospiraceae bacterium]|nr:recombinase family protein [Oscillospiraceae bacterium]
MAIILYASKHIEHISDTSCQDQLESYQDLLKYKEDNEEIITIYDNDSSSENICDDSIQSIMSLVRKGDISAIFIYSVNALSHSLQGFINYIIEFDKYSVTLVSISEGLVSSTPEGKKAIYQLMLIDAMERSNFCIKIGTSVTDFIERNEKYNEALCTYFLRRSPIGDSTVRQKIRRA